MGFKDASHEIVSELKRLAHELGRIPRRDDLSQSKFTRQSIEGVFGTYTEALKAAGLDKKSQREARINKVKSVFSADISETLSKKNPENIEDNSGATRIMVAGDLHFPYSCTDTITAFYQRLDIFRPHIVIQIGDLMDMLSYSKFPRSLNSYSPSQEIELARQCAADFWQTVQSINPQTKCYQILGNHDIRPMKRVIESYPEIEGMVIPSFRDLFTFKNVETIFDTRQELIIDGIVFIHGYMSQLGAHRDHTMMNVVVGHSHTAGVVFRNTPRGILFEANAGYMGDPQSKALGYTPQRMTRWTKSFLEIEKVFDVWQPRVIIP